MHVLGIDNLQWSRNRGDPILLLGGGGGGIAPPICSETLVVTESAVIVIHMPWTQRRSLITQNRLNHCMLLHIHKDKTEERSLECVFEMLYVLLTQQITPPKKFPSYPTALLSMNSIIGQILRI